MGLLGMAFPCPPFLVCREQTPASKTFPEFLRGDLNSCSSGKGEDAETKEEQPGNNSAALGQSPGSASRDTRNSIFKLSTERERGVSHPLTGFLPCSCVPLEFLCCCCFGGSFCLLFGHTLA